MASSSTTALPRSGTQAVERAFAILTAVAAYMPDGAALVDVMRSVGLNRSTTYRLLKCLVRQGALRLEGRDRYFLGPLVLQLGAAARQQEELKALYGPALGRIAQATGDTVFLQMRSGADAVCVDRRLGAYPVQTLIVEVGTRRPLGIGAAGAAILAALPAAEAEKIVETNAPEFARFRATAAMVTKAVYAARELGYVSAPVPGVPGVTAIALPVVGERGKIVAAIAVAAIDQRMSHTRQSQLVKTVRLELRRAAKEARLTSEIEFAQRRHD